jgi:REP element-mobilizing transposase RayT
MEYDGEQHNRRSIRLSGYDYARSGAYFVTVCIQNRSCLFGSIVNGEMKLNNAGRIAQEVWEELPARFPQVGIDGFIVMPNHIHGILMVGAQFIAPSDSPFDVIKNPARSVIGRAPALGEIIRAYKAISTRKIRPTVKADFRWQRNYYEHIVRNEESLNRIREYILNNPIQWDVDRENPAATTPEPENAWSAR